jgi:hypothetical protein
VLLVPHERGGLQALRHVLAHRRLEDDLASLGGAVGAGERSRLAGRVRPGAVQEGVADGLRLGLAGRFLELGLAVHRGLLVAADLDTIH